MACLHPPLLLINVSRSVELCDSLWRESFCVTLQRPRKVPFMSFTSCYCRVKHAKFAVVSFCHVSTNYPGKEEAAFSCVRMLLQGITWHGRSARSHEIAVIKISVVSI